jgi:hypothetical protein
MTNALTSLHEKFCSRDREGHVKQLKIHVDHCSVRTSTASERCMPGIKWFTRPSPESRSECSDLFGTVNNRVEQIQPSDADNCLKQIGEIRLSMFVEGLARVFAAWIDRVRELRENG